MSCAKPHDGAHNRRSAAHRFQRDKRVQNYTSKHRQDIVYTPRSEGSHSFVVHNPSQKEFQNVCRPSRVEECQKKSSRRVSTQRPRKAERSEDRAKSARSGSAAPVTKKTEQALEVFPGKYMNLRGAEETWKAIKDSFYVSCKCICCSDLELYCIQDAEFVLCPVCKAVSPLDSNENTSGRPGKGGIGLGFQKHDLGN